MKDILLLILVSLLFCSCRQSAPEVNLHDYISNNLNLLDISTNRDTLLSNIFTRLGNSILPHKSVQVNKPYQKDIINIYVLDVNKIEYNDSKKFPQKFRDTILALKNNAIALPPDIVLFDITLISELLTNSLFDLIMLVQTSDEFDPLPKDIIHSDNLISLLADYHRLRNIRFAQGIVNEDDQYLLESGFYKKEMKQKFLDMIQLARLDTLLAPAIAPIFYHEVGHLVQNTTGNLFHGSTNEISEKIEGSLQKLALRFWQTRLKKIEDNADEYSIKQLEAFLEWSEKKPNKKPLTSDSYIEQSGCYDDNMSMQSPKGLMHLGIIYFLKRIKWLDRNTIAKLSISSTAKYYRDIVLVQTFQGFHGLDVENALFKFYHKECAPFYKTGGRQQSIEFNNFNDLVKAERGFLPILDENNWTEIKDQFFSHIKENTHSHNFYRVEKILSLIAPSISYNLKKISQWNQGERLFYALFENNPKLLEPHLTRRTNIPVKRLLSSLNNVMEINQAVTCSNLDCFVGYLNSPNNLQDSTDLLNVISSSRTFLEVVASPDGYVMYAKLAFPMSIIPKEFFEGDSEEYKEEAQKWLYNGLASLIFIENAYGEKWETTQGDTIDWDDTPSSEDELLERVATLLANIETSDTGANRFLSFRQQVAHCGAATKSYSIGSDALVEFRTLTPDKWIAIEIIPSQDAPRVEIK